MNLKMRQVSSMHKIRTQEDIEVPKLHYASVLKGQKFSYQIAVHSDDVASFKVTVESELKDCVRLYAVKDIVMDMPVSAETMKDSENNDFITKMPGYMPDLLMPLSEQNGFLSIAQKAGAVWVEVYVPRDIEAGSYDISISFSGGSLWTWEEDSVITQKMHIEVIDAVLPEQKTVYTQWFHVDCIANVHNAELYSEEHWELIDKYMKLASELGINMLLTPVLTPSLDIAEGMYRAKTQLTDIEKIGDRYVFDFSRLRRWIGLCRKNSIKYLEIAPLFSQWGLKYTPNITVTENGKTDYMFGWHINAKSPEYKKFLEQLLPALVEVLREEGMLENTRFHISDEPVTEHLEIYRYAHSIVKPLIGDCKIIDAISEYDFYREGLIDIPVPLNSHIKAFIENKVGELYTYYCCEPDRKESNRHMAMPSYRNRIIGLQMYKYDIKGFLHWGYNFYNSRYSKYQINPYLTTSADSGFQSGDSFSVYPHKDGALPSLRALVFRDALEDIEICRALESYIGKDEVVRIIEEEAGMEITFAEYPRNSEFVPNIMTKIVKRLKEEATR